MVFGAFSLLFPPPGVPFICFSNIKLPPLWRLPLTSPLAHMRSHTYTHKHNRTHLSGSSLVCPPSLCCQLSWFKSLIQMFLALCCICLCLSRITVYLYLTPVPRRAPLSCSFKIIYWASVTCPARFPRVILRVVGSRVDCMDLFSWQCLKETSA